MRTTLLCLSIATLAAGCYNPDFGDVNYFCRAANDPACPDGTTCKPYVEMRTTPPRMEFRCQRPTVAATYDMAGGLIPKTGVYTGTHQNAMLNLPTDCPDSSLEPNDSPDTALDAPLPTPDMPTAKITKMAICPLGPNPKTGNHDVDYFRANTTSFSQSMLSMRVDVFYDITFGDLDVGIFDSTGNLLGSDGSAVSNACATAMVPPGVYYVVVMGANNMDVNRYDVRIRTYTTPQQCPNVPLDMGL